MVRSAGRGLEERGLTDAEATRRLIADGPNELPQEQLRSVWRQAWDVIRQPMLLLLVAAGTVNLLLAEPVDAVILLSFVLVVIGISVYQSNKTEHALVALRDLSAPRALVVRNGERARIPGREVVRGDVIVLLEGDRVPADAHVIDATNLTVDESMLTGESEPVHKPSAGDGADRATVYSGTLIVRGHGTAEVSATGSGSELGRIGSSLASIDVQPTALHREVDRLVGVVAAIGASAALVVVVVFGLTRGQWLEGVLAGIATAMAILPEEFPVVLTVFLALGAWRLSLRNVLTRTSPAIEALGSVTVVCADKTGTLTMNSMTVSELASADEVGHRRVWEASGAGLPGWARPLLDAAALASSPAAVDPMDRACRALWASRDLDTGGWTLEREYPLDESLRAMGIAWRHASGRRVLAVKGAPEVVGGRATHPAGSDIGGWVDSATSAGRRVLGVATLSLEGGLPSTIVEVLNRPDLVHLGMVALHDPVRPGVADAVSACQAAGVGVVMITGDHPRTALSVAAEVGIDVESGCITGRDIAAMSSQDLADSTVRVRVFARVLPEQKLRLVQALQASGNVVAMTGDGVNDAPALRAADIGIAMGARGTDVAREAAALVVTDDDFASITEGIRRGRGIFDNLRKAMAYIVAVHVPIAGMALLPLVDTGWPLVLLPVQLAFLELIIDPACSVVFESEGIDPAIMRHPPRPVGERVLDRRVLVVALAQGFSVLGAVTALYMAAVQRGYADDRVRSVTFVALVVSNLALIVVNRSWQLPVWRVVVERRNPTMKWILGTALAVLVAMFAVRPLREALRFGAVTWGDVALACTTAVVGVGWFEVFKVVAHQRGARVGTDGASASGASMR